MTQLFVQAVKCEMALYHVSATAVGLPTKLAC